MVEKDIRSRVENALKSSPSGYTVSELAKFLKISRQTIAVVLAFYEGAGKVNIRKAGMAKIHYWKNE